MNNQLEQREFFGISLPLHDFLGIELGDNKDGIAEVRIAVGPHLTNGHGSVHGGVMYTLCEVAASYAFYMTVPRGSNFVTSDINVSLITPAYAGILVARAGVLKVGRRMGFVECKVYGDEGILLATGRVSKVILPNQ